MKHYSDPEARQLAMDNLNHQASIRPKVSVMEEVSLAKEMKKLTPLPPHEIYRPTLGYGTTKRVWLRTKDGDKPLGVGNTLAEARADARARLAALAKEETSRPNPT